MNRGKFRIAISVASSLWTKKYLPTKKFLSEIFDLTIAEAFPNMTSHHKLEVSVVFSDNKMVQDYNKNYLGKDRPTNVLSFPNMAIQRSEKNLTQHITSSLRYHILGDIIMGHETILQESLEQDKTFSNHVAHLFTHSILHLLGFDHKGKKDMAEMEVLEINILRKLGITNPFI